MVMEKSGTALSHPVRLQICAYAIVFFCIMLGFPQATRAADAQFDVVSKNPVDYTPVLVGTTPTAQPFVNGFGQIGNTIFAGGRFQRVALAAGTPTYPRSNFFAFDALTGVLKSEMGVGYTDPVFDNKIYAVQTFGNSVFIGGEFNTVNGVSRPKLVKINASTGAIDTSFNPPITTGIVWDLEMWTRPGGTPLLIVGGSVGNKLIALNPVTGANTQYINLGIANPIPGAWGAVTVYNLAINPAGTKLVATGNFQTVSGQSRTRLFVANLGGPAAALDSWYYPGFAKPCLATNLARIAYLQGVDFSPDGSYFVVVATGQTPKFREDIWPAGSAQYHTVCDAAGRFNLTDDQHPVWINYTGGDSMYSVAVTGAAVYVQGHFEWLDNPNGVNSSDGGGAAPRFGIGAIHPVTGKALSWNPYKAAEIGGKGFLVTPAGLWVGSDSKLFDGKPHRGIAFAPLPSILTGAGDIATCPAGTGGSGATAQLLANNPGIVYTLGDNAYQSGTAGEFTNCYNPSWGAQKNRTRPSPGERDYLTTGASGYFNYFGAAAGPADKGYYSYNVGYWHVIVLNSMCERADIGGCGITSPMLTWLKNDLAANPKKCTVAYFHHPLFSSGANGGNSKMLPAFNALYAGRADVVVNGHDNDYERFARLQGSGLLNNNRGVRQFVVGTGGAPLRPFGTNIHPNSEVRNASTFGVLKLKLNPTSYDWEFVPAAPDTFRDSGSNNCH